MSSTAADTLDAPPIYPDEFPAPPLAELLEGVSTGSYDRARAAAAIVRLVCQSTGALGVCFIQLDASGRPTVSSPHLAPPHLAQLPELVQHLLQLAAFTLAEQSPQAKIVPGNDELLAVAVPVHLEQEAEAALCLTVGTAAIEDVATASANLTHLLTWVAAYLSQVAVQVQLPTSAAPANESATSCPALQSLALKAAQAKSLKRSAKLLADELPNALNVTAIAIGEYQRRHDTCRLIGYSSAATIDPRATPIRLLESIMQEAAITAELPLDQQSTWAEAPTGPRRELHSKTGLEVAQSQVLHDASGQLFGVLLCLETASHSAASQSAPLEDADTTLLGTALTLAREAELRLGRRLWRALRRWRHRRSVGIAVLLMALLLLIPTPLRVRCDVSLEPQHHRLISAPYDGTLKETLVEPGEVVSAGQLLARMDDRDIQWELSSLRAELRRFEKSRDAALVAFDTVASQMAELEIDRLQIRIDLQHERLKRLDIRSPIDGIVLSGDLQRREGARVSLGMPLLEVGSIDGLIAELAIADRDISHIETGQSVRCELFALPGTPLQGTLHRIRPRSETREQRNVFLADVTLGEDAPSMRPGMRGTALVETHVHPLGWNLFHRAFEELRLWWL